MPTGPAARITDPVEHPLPPVLTGGPVSIDTLIGFLPAWLGVPLGAVAGLQAAKEASDIVIETAEAATVAAAGTPGLPAAEAAEETTKAEQAVTMGTLFSSVGAGCGASLHACMTPLPIPPHGPGVDITGSATVVINMLPACREGDTILEPLGPPNMIAMGCPTVIIGG